MEAVVQCLFSLCRGRTLKGPFEVPTDPTLLADVAYALKFLKSFKLKMTIHEDLIVYLVFDPSLTPR